MTIATEMCLSTQNVISQQEVSMFHHLVLVFYLGDFIENWGVLLLYDRESKSNVRDFFAICSAALPGDCYDS